MASTTAFPRVSPKASCRFGGGGVPPKASCRFGGGGGGALGEGRSARGAGALPRREVEQVARAL
jgi:hypothetical protein